MVMGSTHLAGPGQIREAYQRVKQRIAEAAKRVGRNPDDVAIVAVTKNATPDQIRGELKAQLTSGVAWTDSMNYLLAQGVDTFVEVGPGDTLLSFMKRIDRKASRVKLTFGENL